MGNLILHPLVLIHIPSSCSYHVKNKSLPWLPLLKSVRRPISGLDWLVHKVVVGRLTIMKNFAPKQQTLHFCCFLHKSITIVHVVDDRFAVDCPTNVLELHEKGEQVICCYLFVAYSLGKWLDSFLRMTLDCHQ